MKSRVLLIVAILFTGSILVGCSSGDATETSSLEPTKAIEYLDTWDDEIASQGKADFETLVLDKDDFTKEAYYNLPEKEISKFGTNGLEGFKVEFFLYKSSKSEIFQPNFAISYGGKDWIFMKSAIFKINDDVMTFSYVDEPIREVMGYGYVFEYLGFEPNKEQINFLGKSKSNSDLDIRIMTNTYEEIKLKEIEYLGMKKILNAYRYYLSTQK